MYFLDYSRSEAKKSKNDEFSGENEQADYSRDNYPEKFDWFNTQKSRKLNKHPIVKKQAISSYSAELSGANVK